MDTLAPWERQDVEGKTPEFTWPITLLTGESFELWKGQRLSGRLISIDTETELIRDRETPRCALACVWTEQDEGFFVAPEDLGQFIVTHSDAWFIGQNVTFDFWVLCRLFADEGDPGAVRAWWDIVRDGRLLDTLILDCLINSAADDTPPRPRDLGTLAKVYKIGRTVNKDDPYRLRYGELLDHPKQTWQFCERGFFEYAGTDPIATLEVFQKQVSIARDHIKPHEKQLLPDSWRRFGPLSCSIQVRGAIALDFLSKYGIGVDIETCRKLHALLEEDLQERFDQVEELFGPDIFVRAKKTGEIKYTASGVPRQSQKLAKEKLEAIAKTHRISFPRVKDGSPSLAKEFWTAHRETDPGIDAYFGFQETAKLLQFFKNLEFDRVFPRYNPFVRTWRTSCSSPNLQQIPRRDEFRRMFVADPGRYLMQIDYSAIELRTLAQVCLTRYGFSQLAKLFIEGVDPHTYTAAKFLHVTDEQFQDLPEETRKNYRQAAKAISFGVSGGLGANTLVGYAKAAYGVEMTHEEASAFREQLTTQIYPELERYLKEDSVGLVAANLRCSRRDVDFIRYMSREQKEAFFGFDDAILSKEEVEPYYLRLQQACKNPKVWAKLRDREDCGRYIFHDSATVITGRRRGLTTYTQSRNTPFQSLAADGAKLALFELLYHGYVVNGFIHDEVIVQLDAAGDLTTQAKGVERIMIDSMKQVCPDVPILCEYLVADRWYKNAPQQPTDSLGRVVPYLGEDDED